MPERLSALPGAVFEGACRIDDAGPRGMISLKGDLASPALKNAATGVAGVDFPASGEARCVGERGLVWMAPDEVLVLVPNGEAAVARETIAKALNGKHHLAVDVSDARALFRMGGSSAREVLARLTPADLRPSAFGPGMARRTRLAQAAAAFWMTDDTTFEVVCFRSVAQYVFDLLSTAAAPGAPIDHF